MCSLTSVEHSHCGDVLARFRGNLLIDLRQRPEPGRVEGESIAFDESRRAGGHGSGSMRAMRFREMSTDAKNRFRASGKIGRAWKLVDATIVKSSSRPD